MLIGMTYDLRSAYLARGHTEEETAEFDRDDTVDAIDKALRVLGHDTDRIGSIDALVARLAAGDRWDLVFNICEGLHGSARESQVPALLDAFCIPYTFSDPAVLALSLNKAWTKAVLADDVPTATYVVVSQAGDLHDVDLPLPVFVKPLMEGTGKGISAASVIRRRADLDLQCRRLLETWRQPVLVERYLPGREFTVGILGTGEDARVLGTFEIVLLEGAEADVYGYVNKEDCETRIEYRLVSGERDGAVRQAEAHALTAWRTLGCRDAGRVDLRCDETGLCRVMEVNPLAGMNPVHSDLPMLATAIGMAYDELIASIVASATTRMNLPGGSMRAA